MVGLSGIDYIVNLPRSAKYKVGLFISACYSYLCRQAMQRETNHPKITGLKLRMYSYASPPFFFKFREAFHLVTQLLGIYNSTLPSSFQSLTHLFQQILCSPVTIHPGISIFIFSQIKSNRSIFPYFSSRSFSEILPPAFFACPPPEPIPSQTKAASFPAEI